MSLYFTLHRYFLTLLFFLSVIGFYAQTDNCGASATLLTPGAFGAACSPVAGNTAGFTDSNQGCANGNEDDDGWYRFVATATSHTVTVTGTGGNDPVLGVYASCGGGNVTGGACVDASGNNGTETCNLSGLTVGATYYICVYNFNAGSGTFNICITTLGPPVTMTNGTTTTGCGGYTFFDPGGTGNYSNNQTVVHTFCPSTSGQCVKAVFTSFDLEDNFDYLAVYDGNSTAAPLIVGSAFSATAPTTLTATNINTTGCLTFRFSSDGGTVASGWQANISCATCVNTPTSAVQQDCQGAKTICNDQSVTGTSLGSGSFNDVNLGFGNIGCLNNYAATPNGSAEHQSHWYYFSPVTSGTISLGIVPSTSGTDYDWAIWGPYTTIPCPPTGAPLRCSAASASGSAGGQTGMGNGATDVTEGSGGNGWVAPIPVTAGQKYILFLDNWNATSAPYTLDWQMGGGASLGCTTLPIELLSFTGTHQKDYNSLEWVTATEIDNDYFTLERSVNGTDWEVIKIIDGAGNSTGTLAYHYEDYAYPGGEINYYRLKQTDFDLHYKYSPIISVEASQALETYINNVYPNPANETIYFDMVTSKRGNIVIEVVDFTGACVYKEIQAVNAGKNTLNTSLSRIKSGIYLLKVTDEFGFSSSTKIVKE